MKNLIRIIVVVIILAVVYIQTRPSEYHVERSTTVNATGDVIYPHIADFHKWGAWSPWEKLDPNMKRTFEGTDGEVGSKYSWVGNKDVGEGSMRITEAKPGTRLGIDLEFLKPFKSSCVTTFVLAPEGPGTKVTWVMEGKNDFIAKAMCVFMNMDKMVGGDFEKGLASLKTVAEATPAAADSTAPAAPTGMAVQ